MQRWKDCVILMTLFCSGIALGLPGNLQTCKRSDTGECLKIAIHDALGKLINGLPEFNFPSINPVTVPSMTIGQGKGPVQVVQNYKDIKFYGIPQAKTEKVEAAIGPTSFELKIDSVISPLKLAADYDFNGRFLVLPVVGVGNCTVTLMNLKTHLVLIGETFEEAGKTYSEIKEVQLNLKPEKVIFKFENMFNGDKKVGAIMDKVINDNWYDVFEDVRPGYEESLSNIIKNIANLIFMKVPYENMFTL